MNELQQIMNASTASAEVKQTAIKLAMEIATPLAYNANPNAAIGDGKFLAILMELFKVLLPILLQLLTPKV